MEKVIMFSTISIALSIACSAQWPISDKRQHGLIKTPATLGGCMIGRISDISYKENGRRPEEKLVDDASSVSAAYLGLKTDSAIFEGPDSYNALASPDGLTGMPGRDGSVLVGRKLIASLMAASGGNWQSAIVMIVAHESAHLRQFSEGVTLSVIDREMGADYLAGWIIGKALKRERMTHISLEGAETVLKMARSGSFSDPQFHGTSQQRVAALREGYAEAFRSGSIRDVPTDKSLRFAASLQRSSAN